MRNIVLKEYPELDYVLIARVREDNRVHEYVCAWAYEKDGTWGQGHYFSELEDAFAYMEEKSGVKKKYINVIFEDDDGRRYTIFDLMENFRNSFLNDEYSGDFTCWLYDCMYHSCVLHMIENCTPHD